MTFEEWFDKEFCPSFAFTNVNPHQFYSVALQAWEAGHEAGREEGFVDGVAEGRSAQ